MGINATLARIRQIFGAGPAEPSVPTRQPPEDAEADDNLAAGAILEPDTCYTAVDFIDMYLELKAMSPRVADWHRLQRATHPPRYYRYRQLVALYRALGMTESVQAAERGDFIQYRPLEQYPLLTQDVRRVFERKSAAFFGDENELPMHHHDVQRIYRYFFEFAEVVAAVEQFNSGWLEASSVAARYMIAATNRYRNRHNKEHIAHLKRLLASPGQNWGRETARRKLRKKRRMRAGQRRFPPACWLLPNLCGIPPELKTPHARFIETLCGILKNNKIPHIPERHRLYGFRCKQRSHQRQGVSGCAVCFCRS